MKKSIIYNNMDTYLAAKLRPAHIQEKKQKKNHSPKNAKVHNSVTCTVTLAMTLY
jgi:hypothetical protein